jgi:hypothetical protein
MEDVLKKYSTALDNYEVASSSLTKYQSTKSERFIDDLFYYGQIMYDLSMDGADLAYEQQEVSSIKYNLQVKNHLIGVALTTLLFKGVFFYVFGGGVPA